jgi:hypothetical protein
MISHTIVGIIAAISFVSGAFLTSPELRAYAANTIFSTDIVDGEVKSVDIGDNQVRSIDIANGGIKPVDIANGAVLTSKIADGAVTAEKLAGDVFDDQQAQIDALTAENAAQQTTIDDLTARVGALEAVALDTDNDLDGFTENQGDCNDANNAVNPGAPEVENGIDDDCDGEVDEGTGGGSIDASGTYSVTPVPSYTCAFNLVDFTISQFVFTDNGGTLTVSGSGLPVDMTGASAAEGAIAVSGILAGDCTETYSLTGSFVSADTWTATFDANYSGSSCDPGWPFEPCVNQSWDLTGQRAS